MTDQWNSDSMGVPSFGAIEDPATPARRGSRRPRKGRTKKKSSDDSAAAETTPADSGGDGEPQAAAGETGAAPRKRRRRGGRGRRSKASANATEEAPAASAPAASAPEEEPPRESADEEGSAPRRRRRRGGRRKTRPDGEAESADAGDSGEDAGSKEAEAASSENGDEQPAGTRRVRRTRGRRRSRKASSADADEAPAEAEPQAEASEAKAAKTSLKGRTRRRRKAPARPVEVEFIPGEDDDELLELGTDAPDLPDLPDEAELIDEPEGEERRGRKKKTKAKKAKKKASRSSKAAEPKTPTLPSNRIIANAADREEVRVAVVEDDQIVDFQMTARRHKSIVNDIYRGRVVNLEPAIGAAFIDFGQGRNGFLHTSDVLSAYGDDDWSLSKLLDVKVDPEDWDSDSSQPDVTDEVDDDDDAEEAPKSKSKAKKKTTKAKTAKAKTTGAKPVKGRSSRRRARPRLPITDLLKKGQSVVVQVTKDAIGDKGPTLTTYISIPGRFLVLMPSMARTGVSRKIDDEKERRRLKRILRGLKRMPEGMGVIVRTAGVGCTQKDLQRDLDYLLVLWEDFKRRLDLGRGPAPLYQESDVAIRTVRDLFTAQTEAVIVDDKEVHERVCEFTERLMPDQLDRIQLHEGPRPVFHTYNIEQDFERIFARRIDLPSGGSIVLDQTEALVAIDVNSGKTRVSGFEFEEIALKTNLEAAPEIARQIRLRDLGGIIVCDFIDMQRSNNRRAVERAFREALSTDRARSKVGRISQFGLLELTRQRLGPGLSRMLFHNCSRCRGSGRVRTPESRAGAILRRLGSALTLKGFTRVELRAQPDVIDYLKENCSAELSELVERHGRDIILIEVPDQVEDSVLRYLRQDGREVRPGGRRKR